MVAASIGASVKKFLFKPPFSTKAKNNGKVGQNVYTAFIINVQLIYNYVIYIAKSRSEHFNVNLCIFSCNNVSFTVLY